MAILNIDENILKIIGDIVYKNSGIVFKDSNLSVLTSRISTKLKEKKVSAEKYAKLLQNNPNELTSFIDFVTTNFTSFFRNARHFEILEKTILPMVVEQKKHNRHITMWSAGSSTGEETYTIAMVVREYFEKNKIPINEWIIEIVGSDISLESLFIAKEGKYPGRSVQKIEPAYIQKYFTPLENGKFYLLKDTIKSMVKFDFHNLIYDSTIDDIDITFCRNVLIYFDDDIQKSVLDKIHKAMVDKGILFIGHSESLVGLYDGFKAKSFDKGIVYVKQ